MHSIDDSDETAKNPTDWATSRPRDGIDDGLDGTAEKELPRSLGGEADDPPSIGPVQPASLGFQGLNVLAASPGHEGAAASPEALDTRTPEERTLALVTEVAMGIRALDLRWDILNERFDRMERDVLTAIEHIEYEINVSAHSGPENAPPANDPCPPPFAIRSDGRMLLSLKECDGFDVSARVAWTGLLLTEAEACDALDRLGDAFADTAAHIAGAMRKPKKPTGEGGDEGQP